MLFLQHMMPLIVKQLAADYQSIGPFIGGVKNLARACEYLARYGVLLCISHNHTTVLYFCVMSHNHTTVLYFCVMSHNHTTVLYFCAYLTTIPLYCTSVLCLTTIPLYCTIPDIDNTNSVCEVREYTVIIYNTDSEITTTICPPIWLIQWILFC